MKKIFSICMILLLSSVYAQPILADEISLTRGSLSQKIVDILEVGIDTSAIENPFTDINPGDEYYDAAVWMCQLGYLGTFPGDKFMPDTKMTNAQTAKVLTSIAFGNFSVPNFEEISEEYNSHWASVYLWKATDSGLMVGVGNYNTEDNAVESSINFELFVELMEKNLSANQHYTEYYYLENAEGSGYSIFEKDYFPATFGTSVLATQKNYNGFTENISLGVHSGIVTKDNTLILSRYYNRNIYEVNLITNTDTSMTLKGKYGATIELPIPTYSDNVFGGWYSDASFQNKVNTFEMPLNGTTLYAKWTKQNVEDESVNYRIDSVTIKDMSGNRLQSIPTGTFLATVSFTNVSSNADAVIIIAQYTDAGAFKGLMYIQTEDVPTDSTIKLSIPVDNTNGDVAKLKAFCWESFSSLTPMGNSVSFPTE